MPAMTPRHKALAADPQAQAAVQAQAGPVPDDVSAWLAGLQALAGVPFAYLVPDARMLPAESIRFFAVDPNWTGALTDGALSLAAATAPAAAAAQALRPAALAASAAPTAYTGFLLRSAAVADWPGLRVSGYADPQAASAALPIVRLERLAPTILLALFAGLIQRVELTEPAQHLHFGVVISATGALQVSLRRIDQTQAGGQPSGSPLGTVSLRQDSARSVLDVTATVAALSQGLTASYASLQPPAAMPHFGAAAFSLQLLQVPASQPFTPATSQAAPAASQAAPVPAAEPGAQ
jgi:hypothetical protein